VSQFEIPSENEVEVTPEIIAAGLSAWRGSTEDEYLSNSTTADLTVIVRHAPDQPSGAGTQVNKVGNFWA